MSEEEKKAIEIIKFLQYKCIEENGTGTMPIYRIDDLANAIKTILNLIEKQQKEIEELKDIVETLRKENVNLYIERRQNENKIKAILEEYKYTEIGDSEKIIEFYKKIQSLLDKE